MSLAVVIRSYRGDREWLTYCLRSINKNLEGHDEVVVILPHGDELHFVNYDFQGARVVWVHDPPGQGYLCQQAVKCCADWHTSCDYILFLDSDCFVTAPLNVYDFFANGKPRMLIRHWQDLGDAMMWREPTKHAIGVDSQFETMAMHPLVYHRGSIERCRKHVEAQHGDIGKYICNRKDRNFSEFNVLGNFCHQFEPHLYTWELADPAKDGQPRTVRQRWSWDGFEKHKDEMEADLLK